MSVPFVLVDGNNLLYRAAFGFPARIYSKQKKDITTIFAFFALLRIACKQIGFPLFPVVFFDGEHSLDTRRKILSTYKENRINNSLNPYGDLPLIVSSLKQLSIPVVSNSLFEADDLIAHFLVHTSQQCPSFIFSTDKDFYQLVNNQVLILNTMRKSAKCIIDEKTILDTFGVLPTQWVYYRALMGDPADFIKGVAGVGPKTARKLLALSEHELREVLLNRYQTSWEDYLEIVSIIQLDGNLVQDVQMPKPVRLDGLNPPGQIIEQLGLWDI